MRPLPPLPSAPVPSGFNPHPAGKPGATSVGLGGQDHSREFQSSPGGEAGCDLGFFIGCLNLATVSILTRRGSRVRPEVARRCHLFDVFQSSPGGEAGCDPYAQAAVRPFWQRFNPHPAGKPGATTVLATGERGAKISVSILTRRGSRVRLSAPRIAPRALDVSILTRRGSRVRPRGRGSRCRCRRSFNPHPAGKPGATSPSSQSHSPESAVSILTRRGSRVRPGLESCGCAASRRFNPHPAGKPGATRLRRQRGQRCRCFNPHPAGKPGATGRALLANPATVVSILTRRGSRVRLHRYQHAVDRHRVSILTRRGSRVRPRD